MPLFCIHPGGGLSWSYSGLMRHLPSDRPIYGLQARGIMQPQIAPQTLDEMAADYLEPFSKSSRQGRTICSAGPSADWLPTPLPPVFRIKVKGRLARSAR